MNSQSVFEMLPNKDLVIHFLLWIFFTSDIKCQNLEEMSKTLDEMLTDTRTFRRPRNYEDTSLIWQEYEFGTGAGNREEVVVTNISIYNVTNVPNNVNQQFLQTKTAYYFIYAQYSVLYIYEIYWDDMRSNYVTSIHTEGRILQFKVFELSNEETGNESDKADLLAVIVVEEDYGTPLYWYRIIGDTQLLYLKWHGVRYFRDMEFTRKGNQRTILLLEDSDLLQSWIVIYSFKVDFNRHSIDIWFCKTFYVPKTLDIQVCPIYGYTVLGLQEYGHINVYRFENDKSCYLEQHDTIKRPDNFTNFICFKSGYIEYLAISGKEPRLLHNFENEFLDNTDLRSEVAEEISWITALPLDTYRDESLLLMQLMNRTVIALIWQGSRFKRVSLPNQIMNDFDLSKMIIIPKIGFLYENMYIRVETTLREMAHPVYEKMESMLKTQALLEEVFQKQEAVFDETEIRLNQSHLIPTTTGSWNLSDVIVSNATFEKNVRYGRVMIGSVDLGVKDLTTNITLSLNKLKELEARLDEILPNFTDASNITLPPSVELIGDFLVNGTLFTKRINAAAINDASIVIADNITNSDVVIHGWKSFPSINTDNLTVTLLNGVPLEEITFDASLKDYNDVDFTRLKRLEIQGHLNFSEINNVNWQNLMQSIVWKDKSAVIEEISVDEVVVKDEINVVNLNQLPYPQDYVLTDWINTRLETDITGEKYFDYLSVKDLVNVDTINDINITDFIILGKHEVINKGITFEDLEIDGTFLLDGNITGVDLNKREGLLNETNEIFSNVIFENLNVMGNVIFEDSINTKTWSDFDDILLKNEKSAVITGNKKFLNNVNVESNVTIEYKEINGHAISEFVTLNSDQQFPYLKKISANVTFGNVTLGVIQKLEDYITHKKSVHLDENDFTQLCLPIIVIFNSSLPPVVDNLHFDMLLQNISRDDFFNKLNRSLQNVYCENLSPLELMVDEILPKVINGLNYTDLVERALRISTKQILMGDLIVDNLETELLTAQTINGISLDDLHRTLTRAMSLTANDSDMDPPMEIGSLRVLGRINVSSINDVDVHDIYEKDNMVAVIFRGDVFIKNLTVTGFVNGFNLSQIVDDAVGKADRNVTFTSHKMFENFTCEYLDARFVNEHFVGDLLNADQNQTLKGPVTVTGSVTVLREFNTNGKIGPIFLHDFTNRFQLLGNDSYVLHGDFYFPEITSITNLEVNGSIQQSIFDDFLRTIISQNDANVTIFGSKLFNNSVIFTRAFIIDGNLNGIDLHEFHENAVYIDKPFSINSDIVFKEDVHVQKDIVVKTKLQSNTIWGVDMKELQESVIALDKLKYFSARMTFENVTFQENVEVEQVNDLQMDLLITLHKEQFIPIDRLHCTNISAKNLYVSRYINTYTWDDIYENTFMVYGNQNITGNITIQGNVYAYHDFNAHFINNFNPKHIISLNANDTLFGNFMFKNPVVLDKSLRILGLLNGINPINWHGTAVKTIESETKQIISGKWRVHGNVHFQGDINGSEILNGVNVTELSAALAEEHASINQIGKIYEDLINTYTPRVKPLVCDAAHQVYKFDRFDYLKVPNFAGDIHDIRKVEVDNLDYLLVNYDTCHLKLLMYTSIGFKEVDVVSNFGLIDQWTFFNSNHSLYLFTVANRSCSNSLNNIWKLENNKLMHILELGNITNIINQDGFVGMIRENLENAPENVQSDILEAVVSYKNEALNPISDNKTFALTDQFVINEMQARSHDVYKKDCTACRLNFKIGIYNREEYLYYNEDTSQEYIYLYKTQKNDSSQMQILQTIKTYRPKSFLILNFNGLVETLLIIAENNDTLQIYEYRGIENFVHKDTIKIKIDKLYNFKIRKHTDLDERYCLAVVHEGRLTILEAKMHGEKLNLKKLDMSEFCHQNNSTKFDKI